MENINLELHLQKKYKENSKSMLKAVNNNDYIELEKLTKINNTIQSIAQENNIFLIS